MVCYVDPSKSRGSRLYPLERQCPIFFAPCNTRNSANQSGGKFYCIPFLCAVLWESWSSLSLSLSRSTLHSLFLTSGGNWRKSMGSVCAESLAVIGYIFIIIYSNRKRYLGMGMYGYGEMGLLGDPRAHSRRDVDDDAGEMQARFCVCVCMSLRTVREMYTFRSIKFLHLFLEETLSRGLRRYHIYNFKFFCFVAHNRTCSYSSW